MAEAVAPWLRRLPRVHPLTVNLGLAAIFVVVVAVEAAGRSMPGTRLVLLAGSTAVLAACIGLARQVPLTALVVAAAAQTAESFLHIATEFSPLATLVGAYFVGQDATRRRAWWGPLVIAAAVVGFFAGTPGLTRTDPSNLFSVLVVWLVAWGVGFSAARRRGDQERARRALERQVVAEERVRLSREVHDIVGHTVSLFVVHAGAARVALDHDPSTARSLLSGMEEAGRATMAELDRVLASLRPDDGADTDAGAGPAPGLAQLPELVARLEGSGVDVRLRVDGALRLPRDLDVSAYRIVQEALTNTLKHAAPCSADVVVEPVDGSLVVEVADSGPGVRATGRRGRGLLGIGERVSMLGGVLEHGNGERGGFRVRAVLPLP